MLGFIGMMEENGTPIQFGLRLAINDNGEITEAEHMVVRSVRETSLPKLETARPAARARAYSAGRARAATNSSTRVR